LIFLKKFVIINKKVNKNVTKRNEKDIKVKEGG